MENNNNVVVEETNQEKLYYPAEEVISDDLNGKKITKAIVVGLFAGATIAAGVTFITKKIKAKKLKIQIKKDAEKVEEDYVETETDEDSGKTEK